MADNLNERSEYWAQYYARKPVEARFETPSQFAAFVAQELPKDVLIFDVGCGTARDALFFALLGFDVMGVDECPQAVDLARKKAAALQVERAQFLQANIRSDALYDELARHGDRAICVYARFFLHAITDDEQDYFFNALAKVLKPGDMLAFEYRNNRDEEIAKEADPHFRRYQPSENVDLALQALGFDQLYGVEGRGFAKYKSEDANVSRSLHQKRGG